MENSIWFMLLLQLLLIGCNAIFACAEIAVISMNDTKLNKMASEGDKRAKKLVKLTAEPARFLATIQVAITLSGFLGSAFAAENFSGVLVQWLLGLGVPISAEVLDTLAVILITIILSYFTLVLGELLPKQIAMRKSEVLALKLASLISAIAKVFKPLVSFLTWSTNSLLRLVGIDPNAQDEEVGEEEIRMMVDVGSEKGTIDHDEREFIQNVFEFDDLFVDEIMTHRTDMTYLDLEDDMESWRETIFGTRHTRYPICDGSVDKVVGILNAKDYFRLEDFSRENVMQQAVKLPYFVPDTIKADVLFRNMKKERTTMAVVLDEYGGVEGIVTISDLVEQLVGELGETKEDASPVIELVGENTWKVHGSALIEDLSDAIGVSLPEEEFDTFNGLVFHCLENIPRDGADIEIEFENLKIKVTELENHQVEEAIIIKKELNEEEKID